MVHEEHDGNAENSSHQREPLVVVLEGGSPAGALGHAGVEHGEVDQSVRRHEEVGLKARHNVQVPDKDADKADGKDCNVAPDGVVIPAVADTEGLNVGEEFVLGESLQDPGGSLQAGDGGGEGRSEAAGVYDGTPGTHHLHHLEQTDGSQLAQS